MIIGVLRRFRAIVITGAVFATMAAAVFSASTPSAACCGDGPIAAAGATSAGAAVSAAIGTATTAVVTVLMTMTTTISTGFAGLYEQIAKQTASQRLIEQGSIEAQTSLLMSQRAAEAEETYALTPRACFETATGVATTVADGERRQVTADLSRTLADRVLHTPSTAAAVMGAAKAHEANNCSAVEARLGRCTAAATDMQNADVRADFVLSKEGLDPEQMESAQRWMTNVVNPMPTQTLPEAWLKSSAGKTFLAGQQIEQSRLSVAAAPFVAALAERTRVPALGTAAMVGQSDVSDRELMGAQVRGRFESPQWYVHLAMMGEANLLRELNKQAAFGLWMEYRNYERLERMEMALGADLAVSSEATRDTRLAQARDAAARAARQ